MKYLKSYIESLNIYNDRHLIQNLDIDEQRKSDKLDDLILSYKEKIDECILYLIEKYDVEYNDPSSDMGAQSEDIENQDTFQYSFDLDINDNISECITDIKLSISRLEVELDANVELQVYLLRGSIYGSLDDIEFGLLEEYDKRLVKIDSIRKLGHDANTFLCTINLIIT